MDRQTSNARITHGTMALSLVAAALLLTAAAHAQATDARRSATLVRVHVADSTGVPMADADVSLMRGLKDVVATARTDAAGNHEFIVDLDSTDYSIVARKIGFARGDRFFNVRAAGVDVPVTLHRVQNALPAVTVSADNLRFKSYNIDADQIAAAAVPVNSALDIVERLRPDMITSRSGTWGGGSRFGCGPMQYVWVNDQRYIGSFTSATIDVAMRAKGPGNRIARVGTGNMAILSEIAPEHIAEMHYRDCFDPTERRVGTTDALFIILKDGVAYKPGRGTYVVGDAAAVANAR